MNTQNRLSDYPQRLRVSTQRPDTYYVRLPGCYAVHHRPRNTLAPGAILVLNQGSIAVFPGEPPADPSASATLSPVYALQPNGPPAVPTGLVFVRLVENATVEAHRERFERAGYEIAQSLDYAPQAAWLRARSGDSAQALSGIAALEVLPEVANVEPQMLMECARRR